ncbi:5'-3' exonuclease [Vibrio phage 1.208.B._10N.222.52.A7]|nr:5'-3' exonuclease [Vibrio phage 1.208.B._10N.222.52.A7]
MAEGTHGLIDFDLWLYDIGFGAERGDDGPLPFELVKGRVDERMAELIETLDLTAYEGYFTGSGNFRYDIAKTVPYKGNRNKRKPFHFENIKQYIIFRYNASELNGIETDDMLAVRQKQLGNKSIIVSRDKDLRMVNGWHYGYECGKQGEFGPLYVSGIGDIDDKGKGIGIKFFWAQMLMGDNTDNIVGCRNRGKVFAYKQLNDLHTEDELATTVAQCYMDVYGEEWNTIMLEQGRLLWMHDTLNEDGTPVLWQLPKVVEGLTYEA